MLVPGAVSQHRGQEHAYGWLCTMDHSTLKCTALRTHPNFLTPHHRTETFGDYLTSTYHPGRVKSVLQQALEDPPNLVITGHSLGAAVACMLSFQLRQEFPGRVIETGGC